MNAEGIQNLGDCTDPFLAGTKACRLGSMLRAGFVVPPGFVITTEARGELSNGLGTATARRFREFNAGFVAVRSSATVEDLPDASLAGQYTSTLNVRGERQLHAAIRDCLASMDSPRIRAYLSKKGKDGDTAMAVIVQEQIAAEVSGVLFTTSPHAKGEMLVEASWGLGETLVSGQVQPDAFRLNASDGSVIASRISDKKLRLRSGGSPAEPVEDQFRRVPCLTAKDLAELWKLGRAVAAHFAAPQDIEWAMRGGEIFLLQARPIVPACRATSRRHDLIEITRNRLAEMPGGAWALHNLAETFPFPTPLTWSVMSRFMSGSGGFGAAYKRLGFTPSARVCCAGFLELILGRPYVDLSRAPELFGADFPFAYDLDLLASDPETVHSPPSVPNGSILARLAARRRMVAARRMLGRESLDLERRFRDDIIPTFEKWCAGEKQRDLASLAPSEWVALWNGREQRIMDQFAVEATLATLVAGDAMALLGAFLEEHFPDEDPGVLAQTLCSDTEPTRTLAADAELYEVATGKRSPGDWLERHGHRAVEGLDFASPRWRECPDDLLRVAARIHCDPRELHHASVRKTAEQLQILSATMGRSEAKQLRKRVSLARRYLRIREDAKDSLLLGYDLLRDMALEASRRLRADVFQLSASELAESISGGVAPHSLIEERKFDASVMERISLPRLIGPLQIAALGDAAALERHELYNGLPISRGLGTGQVRLVESPGTAVDLGSAYVLVCRSLDPAWTPLMMNAVAIVVECGGILSHGAIVARELGIPAVVLENATRILCDGETVSVDGSKGVVARGEVRISAGKEEGITRDQMPPPQSARERRSAVLRNAGFSVWALYLAAVFLLPRKWLYEPSMQVLDWVFWPMIRHAGKPMAVAIIGVALAVLTALLQRSCTDHKRLRVAKQRAQQLRKKAAHLPAGSPLRARMFSLAAPVQSRVAAAAFVPLGLLFGIYTIGFMWLSSRMNPANANPPPGSTVRVIACLDAGCRKPIHLSVPAPLALDESSLSERSLPPIEETLSKLILEWQSSGSADKSRLADLQKYLAKGIPPQTVSWTVHAPSGIEGPFQFELAVGNNIVTQPIIFGNSSPSPVSSQPHDLPPPFRALKVESLHAPVPFWKPFVGIGSEWDAGWLGIYLLSNIPGLLLARVLLRLP